MDKKKFSGTSYILMALVIAAGILLASCAPQAALDPTPIPPNGSDETRLPAGVLQQLASRFNVDQEEIEVSGVSRTEWMNACLGFADVEEMCAEVITPGYGGVALVEGEYHTFRTNEDGSVIKILPPAVNIVRETAAEEQGVSVESVTILEVQAVEWPDACLGMQTEDLMCAQVITPGFRVTINIDNQIMIYRTDLEGKFILRE